MTARSHTRTRRRDRQRQLGRRQRRLMRLLNSGRMSEERFEEKRLDLPPA